MVVMSLVYLYKRTLVVDSLLVTCPFASVYSYVTMTCVVACLVVTTWPLVNVRESVSLEVADLAGSRTISDPVSVSSCSLLYSNLLSLIVVSCKLEIGVATARNLTMLISLSVYVLGYFINVSFHDIVVVLHFRWFRDGADSYTLYLVAVVRIPSLGIVEASIYFLVRCGLGVM